MTALPKPVQSLLARGIKMPAPETVLVSNDVDLTRIADDVTIHPGCRITGKQTVLSPGSVLGEEAPLTIASCQVGKRCRLKGGYLSGATLLDRVEIASGAHIRPGTLLEEQASCGHTVALKQTILMPFVSAGSLINFCDCLMAGGTGRKNHSAIGSSYIHFNFTPQQDKATASLIGDVPRGVMLNNPPIFLGGQGGMVGPTRIEYGTTIAAGVICRHDQLVPGCLVSGGSHASRTLPYRSEVYGDISRRLRNNFLYLGNLYAMLLWYRSVRPLYIRDEWDKACHVGALLRLQEAIAERIARLTQLANNLQRSDKFSRSEHDRPLPEQPFGLHRIFCAEWPSLSKRLNTIETTDTTKSAACRQLLGELETHPRDKGYVDAIQGLSTQAKSAGTAWLQAVVARTEALYDELG